MNRLYGWSAAGEQAVITMKTRGKRLSIVGAMALDGPRGKMLYEGTLNGDGMVRFVMDYMGPNLKPGDIVVMDGLSVHKTRKVSEALACFGATALFLPPYSPELNPIEHLWSTLKARLRAVGASTWDALHEVVEKIWGELDDSFYANWVRHCGYGAST